MKKICYYTLILFALFLTACEGTDKLQADIDSLANRIADLENKVEMLNGNIKALNILCQDGIIISKVEHDAKSGVYTIILSDGTSLKLAEKIDGFGSVPLVSIDEKGFWQVSYDNGKNFTSVLKDGVPVQAVGKDGITPVFRVGAHNYWEISVDGGTSYVTVKDEQGNPVMAVYEPGAASGRFFDDVIQKEEYLEVKLSGGETVRVPIVPNFFCYFDAAITGEQKVKPNETKIYLVHIKGVASTLVTTPAGWKATLGEATNEVAKLTVTAPAASTRAVADNTRDISILAIKGTFATLTKIQVNAIQTDRGIIKTH